MNQIGKNLHKLCQILMIVTGLIYSSQISAQITAVGSCNGITTNNEYTVNVAGLSSGSTYDIYINNVLDTNNVTGITSFTSSNQSFISGTRTILARIVLDPDGNLGIPDTTDILVHEVLCIDADSDGDLDYNEASCDFTKALPNVGTIVSTVAPYNTDNVYLYVLTDSNGVVANPIVSSYSGHFTNLANGDYKVFAYNFLDSLSAATFLTGDLTPGTSDLDAFTTGSDPICYMFCGDASYTINCACPVDINADPDDISLCVDDSGEMVVVTSTSVSAPVAMLPSLNILEYQWQQNTGGGFVDFADTDSILNLNNVTYAMNGYTYRVIVTLDVNGTNICSDTSAFKTLTVYPEPMLASNLDATVCSDEVSGIELLLNGSNPAVADSFDIISITNAGGLVPGGSNAVAGITDDSLVIAADTWTNTKAAVDSIVYKIAPISTDGCTGDTIDIILRVNPEPLFTGNLDLTVCSDEVHGIVLPTAVSGDLNVAIDSFVVAAVVGAKLTGTATTGNTTDASFIASDVFNNVSAMVDTVTYTITPFTNGCVGSDFVIKVAVKPEPKFVTDLDDVVCSDEIIGVTLPATDSAGLAIDSFDIVAVVGPGLNGTATVGTGMTSIDTIKNDKYNNISTAADSVVYTLTPYTMGCVGSDFTITVVVTPEPLGKDSTLTVCSDQTLSIDLQSFISNGLTSVSFEWFAIANGNVLGETVTNTTSVTIADNLNNVTGSDQTVIYKVIPTASVTDRSCVGDTMTITVNVRPEPVYDNELVTECSDVALDIDLTDNMTGGSDADGFTYTVASSDPTNVPGGSARTDTTLANITDTYTNTTGDTVTITYTVTPISSFGCAGNTFTVTVTINPEPVLAIDLNKTLCSNSVVEDTLRVASGSVAADSFDIVAIIVGDSLTSINSISTGRYDSLAIASDKWENISSVTDSVVYRVIPISADGCFGDTVNVVITIDPEVVLDAGDPITICSTVDVMLADLSPSISGGTTLGTWSSGGDGKFYNGSNTEDASFSGALRYDPSDSDKANGSVTLTLTSDNPAGACGEVLDTVVITINSVECGTFPWNGGE